MKTKKAKGIVDAPKFRSEDEEAAWWDQHQEFIADLLVKHGRRGAVPTKNISVPARSRRAAAWAAKS